MKKSTEKQVSTPHAQSKWLPAKLYISFVVNIAPMGQNKIYRRRRGYGMYMIDEARKYKADIGWMARAALGEEGLNVMCFTRPSVSIDLYYGNKYKNDIDGPIKLILDSLNEIAWADDSMIVELKVYKKYDPSNPRVEIIIME